MTRVCLVLQNTAKVSFQKFLILWFSFPQTLENDVITAQAGKQPVWRSRTWGSGESGRSHPPDSQPGLLPSLRL